MSTDSTKLKILIVSDAWHPQLNGVVMTYVHLKDQLEQMGHTVDVIGPAEFPFKVPMPGYAEIQLVLGAYTILCKKIQKLSPDIIHIATEGPLGSAARRYCIRHNISFTTSYHTHFPDYAYERFAYLHTALGRFARTVTKNWVRRFHAPSARIMISTKSLEETLKNWGFQTPMTRMIRGADLDLFYPLRPNSNPASPAPYEGVKGPIALYVGRVAVEKNLEDFLDMDWDGSKIIVGDGPSLPYLQNKYPDAIFMGRKTGQDLAACYRAADVFVFPSKTDTFGIVLIEALASGLPVAAYTVTGPKDIITQPFLGVLTDDNLSHAAYAALKCGRADERENHVKTLYTWDNAAKQFLAGITETP